MSINEQFENMFARRVSKNHALKQESLLNPVMSRRELFKKAALGALVIGGLSMIPFNVACSPEVQPEPRSQEETEAENEALNNLQLYDKAMNFPTVKDNPDRAVVMVAGALNFVPRTEEEKSWSNEQKLDKIRKDYDTLRQDKRIPEDQAAVLATASNVNSHNMGIDAAFTAYQWFGTRYPKVVETPAQQAALASIVLVNTPNGEIDQAARRFEEASKTPGIDSKDAAIAYTQYSFLSSDATVARSSFKSLLDSGMSKELAILLLPAVIRNSGDATPIIAEIQEVKQQLDPNTPDKDRVATDIVNHAHNTNQDSNRVVYVYNHYGYWGGSYGGGFDYCRSMSLAGARSGPALATNHATQMGVRGHTAGHTPFNSIYVSGKAGGIGAGSAATGRGSFSNSSARFGGSPGSRGGGFAGGRGGVSGGGVGGSGGG